MPQKRSPSTTELTWAVRVSTEATDRLEEIAMSTRVGRKAIMAKLIEFLIGLDEEAQMYVLGLAPEYGKAHGRMALTKSVANMPEPTPPPKDARYKTT
ncbi:MAG: hypothetical protein IPK85_03410 [Gemmatimonadetes bacterium]|nr:hypothetical protein [Gemmatimonadota bacterium]